MVSGTMRITVIFLPAFRQRVGFGVVEERVIAITPREAASSDAQVLIRDKLGLVVVIVVLHLEEVGVQGREDDGWHGDVEEDLLPELGIRLVAGVGISRHKATHGHASEHRITADELRKHLGRAGAEDGCKKSGKKR